jgi:hypothetical protein
MGLILWKRVFLLLQLSAATNGFFHSLVQQPRRREPSFGSTHEHTTMSLYMDDNYRGCHKAPAQVCLEGLGADTVYTSRRSLMFQSATFVLLLGFNNPKLAMAAAGEQAAQQPTAQRKPLGDLIYTILRVREATSQESRLIRSGKFKDVQRANIKLAVKFMVQNYRLADTFIAACTYLDGTDRRLEAGQVGQAVVQNLVTITEYFDSSDVQNLKVKKI